MNDNRTAKQLFYGELVVGSRPVGRPRLRYKDNIKALLKIGGIVDTWSDLALDRPVVVWMSNELKITNEEKRKEEKDSYSIF